nr:hypothetical protein [Microbacterium sp. W4I4]
MIAATVVDAMDLDGCGSYREGDDDSTAETDCAQRWAYVFAADSDVWVAGQAVAEVENVRDESFRPVRESRLLGYPPIQLGQLLSGLG